MSATTSRSTVGVPPFAPVASLVVAGLVAIVSIVGIRDADVIYAHETPNWAAQGVGQDWVDLMIGVPWLVVSALLSLRGSRRATFVLAGALLYVFYEFVIYGFAVHFNPLFLAYCGTLGLSFFALAGLALELAREDVVAWYETVAPRRTAGFFLIGVGTLFALGWLGDVVPALFDGTVPASVREAGAATNPVYVIDLSVILPLHVFSGVALLRRGSLGYALAPVVLAFGVGMALSIGGMMFVMRARGIDANLGVAAAMFAVAAASAGVLALVLRRVRSS